MDSPAETLRDGPRRGAGRVYVVAALLFALPTFLYSIAALAHIARAAFPLDQGLHSAPVAQFLPGVEDSARFNAIREICRRRPRGTVGMDALTYMALMRMERGANHEASYLEMDKIVKETGQPVRFKGKAPSGVAAILKFLPGKSGVPEIGPRVSGDPIEAFEDMGLFAPADDDAT